MLIAKQVVPEAVMVVVQEDVKVPVLVHVMGFPHIAKNIFQ